MNKKITGKKGLLGTPLGNPLAYFNSLKTKKSKEPKQSLKKAQPGIQVGPMTQEEAIKTAFASAENDPMNYGQGPRMTTPSDDGGINLFLSRELPEPSGPIMHKSSGVRQMMGLEKRKGGSVKRK